MGNKTTHYTVGYGGKLNYATMCGKEIHSHSNLEGATIDPKEVTCKKCLATSEWKEDYGYSTGVTKTNIKRRIYLESDVLHASELRSAQREVSGLCDEMGVKYIRRVFSEILDYAWHDLEKTWKAVKQADEIYSDSSLMPITGGNYMGAPVIFNGMMERAIKEKVTGKSVYILTEFKDIYWNMIKTNLMKDAFAKNKLFMYDSKHNLALVDLQKVPKTKSAK